MRTRPRARPPSPRPSCTVLARAASSALGRRLPGHARPPDQTTAASPSQSPPLPICMTPSPTPLSPRPVRSPPPGRKSKARKDHHGCRQSSNASRAAALVLPCCWSSPTAPAARALVCSAHCGLPLVRSSLPPSAAPNHPTPFPAPFPSPTPPPSPPPPPSASSGLRASGGPTRGAGVRGGALVNRWPSILRQPAGETRTVGVGAGSGSGATEGVGRAGGSGGGERCFARRGRGKEGGGGRGARARGRRELGSDDDGRRLSGLGGLRSSVRALEGALSRRMLEVRRGARWRRRRVRPRRGRGGRARRRGGGRRRSDDLACVRDEDCPAEG